MSITSAMAFGFDAAYCGGCVATRASSYYDTETGQPLVITQNGRPAGVLLSPAEFDRLVERYLFVRAVEEGVADADSGSLIDGEALRARLGLGRPKRR